MTDFVILPAVDLMGGQAVQLVRGAPETAKRFGDPVAAALRWRGEGAEWLHLVDLDAAFGNGDNAEVARRIIAESGLKVELTGGIRDDAALERALATGCERVNLGTAALEDPEWTRRAIERHGDKVAVAIDVRDGKLAGRGWTTSGGDPLQAVDALTAAGCARFVVTDVGSDGGLGGPNVGLLEAVCARTTAKVVASGGVTTAADVRALAALAPLGVEGAIIGTALYVGPLTLGEAMAAAAG